MTTHHGPPMRCRGCGKVIQWEHVWVGCFHERCAISKATPSGAAQTEASQHGPAGGSRDVPEDDDGITPSELIGGES